MSRFFGIEVPDAPRAPGDQAARDMERALDALVAVERARANFAAASGDFGDRTEVLMSFDSLHVSLSLFVQELSTKRPCEPESETGAGGDQ